MSAKSVADFMYAQQDQIERLYAKLAIATKALEEIGSRNGLFGDVHAIASRALDEIKRGEG